MTGRYDIPELTKLTHLSGSSPLKLCLKREREINGVDRGRKRKE
jgi:hypothetical protein